MSDVLTDLNSWSTTAGSNLPTGATNIGTGLDDNLGQIQAVVRKYLATKGADIASASTTDLSTATGLRVDITGTTTITAFGTLTAGMWKVLKFTGILTLTYNATSLITPTAANITTAAGDYAFVTSLGSGNWEVNFFQRASGLPLIQTVVDSNFKISGSSDATKLLAFEVDTNTPTATTLTITPGQGQILPAGIGPLPYSGSSIPAGWLYCDGSAVSRTTYVALFAAISTTWGVGDGSTTFNLPDMRGRSAIGDGTGTVFEACTASSSNGFTVVSNATKWNTGQAVVLSNLSGFTTTATAGPTYFVTRISATNVRLATTLALAQNLTPDITISGSGTVTLTGTLTARTLGQNGGEETHAMSLTELLSHTHILDVGNGAGGLQQAVQATGTTGTITGNHATGGNAAMNIMQPFIVTKYIISY